MIREAAKHLSDVAEKTNALELNDHKLMRV
jgi:hypothetical protein